MKRKLFQIFGLVGVIVSIGIYIRRPSYPGPDKIFVFLTLLFMAFGQGWQLFKRLAPFVVLLFVYESFRGVADALNVNVNFYPLINADRLLALGNLPTKVLQNWLWQGSVRWYDFVLYLFYLLHFVLPFALAILIWKKRESYYWRYITTFLLVSFAGFITFLIFPAAPPWMASQHGYIEPITHISGEVWQALGIQDFPTIYAKVSPNPVAAMPSLHAAYSTLIALFTIRLFNRPERWLALIYPAAIYFGTVYLGEHYIIDELAGGIYALAAYAAAPWVLNRLKKIKIPQLRR